MTYAIILAGGTGTRLGGDIPKQYIEINGKPIISYCLEKFEHHQGVDSIIVVANQEWKDYVENIVSMFKISKFIGISEAGKSRQHSILSGLKFIKNNGGMYDDFVIIHDAARPNITENLITNCIDKLSFADGAMPVLHVKDTIYISEDGEKVNSLLNRDMLYAGQAPESYHFGKYYNANLELSESELLKIRGSTEVAYKAQMIIDIFEGDEDNYKITTKTDLNKFIEEQSNKLVR